MEKHKNKQRVIFKTKYILNLIKGIKRTKGT